MPVEQIIASRIFTLKKAVPEGKEREQRIEKLSPTWQKIDIKVQEAQSSK